MNDFDSHLEPVKGSIPTSWGSNKWVPSHVTIRSDSYSGLNGTSVTIELVVEFGNYRILRIEFESFNRSTIPLECLRFPISTFIKEALDRHSKKQINPNTSERKLVGNSHFTTEEHPGEFFPRSPKSKIPFRLQEVGRLFKLTPSGMNPADYISESLSIKRTSAVVMISQAKRVGAIAENDSERFEVKHIAPPNESKSTHPGFDGNLVEHHRKSEKGKRNG